MYRENRYKLNRAGVRVEHFQPGRRYPMSAPEDRHLGIATLERMQTNIPQDCETVQNCSLFQILGKAFTSSCGTGDVVPVKPA